MKYQKKSEFRCSLDSEHFLFKQRTIWCRVTDLILQTTDSKPPDARYSKWFVPFQSLDPDLLHQLLSSNDKWCEEPLLGQKWLLRSEAHSFWCIGTPRNV